QQDSLRFVLERGPAPAGRLAAGEAERKPEAGVMPLRIAVAGAGIYGSTIALKLASEGHRVTLHDPLGVLRAASAINQCRIHRGYHYPRSPETITETLEARGEFVREFGPAVLRGTRHYYAIAREGSRTSPE